MKHILHDVSVWWWGVRSRHPLAKCSKLAIIWPVSIRPHKHLLPGKAWVIRTQKPSVHLLNQFEMEVDYVRSKKAIAASK